MLAHYHYQQYFDQLKQFQTCLDDHQLLTNVTEIAQEHHFSQSLADLIKQTDKLSSLVETFPKELKFNLIPEHRASPNHQLALESLVSAATEVDDRLKLHLTELVKSFLEQVKGSNEALVFLENNVVEKKQVLMLSDLTQDVLEDIPVYSVSQEALMTTLTILDDLLRENIVFTSEDYRAYPAYAEQDLRHLKEALLPLGKILGLKFGPHGIETDRIEDVYLPTSGTFGTKGYSLEGLTYLLEVSEMILISLKSFTSRIDVLETSLEKEAVNLPESIGMTKLDYDKFLHITLLVSYLTFTTKTIQQAFMSISLLLTMLDTALHVTLEE